MYLNPIEPFNFSLKLSFIAGAIMASPFILYQVWLFISPGLYRNEKRYVWPFMGATVTLFLAGAFFGYHFVYPGALDFLLGYGKQFHPHGHDQRNYCDLFMTVILGMGASFELPVLVYFLALFGIVTPKWLWKNIKYAILIIVIIAAAITPTLDPFQVLVFATPMLGGFTCWVFSMAYHGPSVAARSQEAGGRILIRRFCLLAVLLFELPLLHAQSPAQFSGAQALAYTREFVACGPRFNGSAGLLCAQNYLKKQFAHDNLQSRQPSSPPHLRVRSR